MTPITATQAAPISWQVVTPAMWVATQHGDLVATIEQLRVFFVTNPSGDVIGTYSCWDDARSAVEQPLPAQDAQSRHKSRRTTTLWPIWGARPARAAIRNATGRPRAR